MDNKTNQMKLNNIQKHQNKYQKINNFEKQQKYCFNIDPELLHQLHMNFLTFIFLRSVAAI